MFCLARPLSSKSETLNLCGEINCLFEATKIMIRIEDGADAGDDNGSSVVRCGNDYAMQW